MPEETDDGNHRHERFQTSHMVGVKMRHHVIVDLLQSGRARDRVNALGVPIVGSRKPAVDQQRLAGR
jgi:hypothetical protein